jgi:capsular polysaccharide export protein
MSKFLKLIKNPGQFFLDALYKRKPELKHKVMNQKIAQSHRIEKPTAILLGFSDWKTWMQDALCDYNVVFMGHSPNVSETMLNLIPRFYSPNVFVWSYKYPERAISICKEHDISLTFVEDGFLRSVGLGIEKSRPLSLVFDKKAMHFDAFKPSSLDEILNKHDFVSDTASMQLAQELAEVITSGATKYMRPDSRDNISEVFGLDADEHVVVVLGQVEDDLSIRYGSEKFYSGVDLVKIAAIENPHSRILYRPHPEAIARRKQHYSDPKSVKDICEIVGRRWSLNETLSVASRVYTITSFSGFEAALRGIDVDLFGFPFYGGWGFTNDRHSIPLSEKRRRQLKPAEVLAGALVLYPDYFHPVTGQRISPETAISIAWAINIQLKSSVRRKISYENLRDSDELDASQDIEDIARLVVMMTEFKEFLETKAPQKRH